jgi:chromosome segregation protein
MLNEMRRLTATRFIAITHNPVTMARMDRLYGVTMPERGVSQLVSVDLRQAEAMAAQ